MTKTTIIPTPTPDQAEYLKRLVDTTGKFDPNVMIRGNDPSNTTGSKALAGAAEQAKREGAEFVQAVIDQRKTTILAAQVEDDRAIDAFAIAMSVKMDKCRAKGRGGWQTCSNDELWGMLREHVEKGDPVDVANIAMMIYHNSRRNT